MTSNRPQGRQRGQASTSGSVEKKGRVSTGKVGNENYSPRKTANSPKRSGGDDKPQRSGGRGSSGFSRIIFLIALTFIVFRQFGNSTYTGNTTTVSTPAVEDNKVGFVAPATLYTNTDSEQVNLTVHNSDARDYYTSLVGGGNDRITILIYMCGSNLESDYGMATSDLNEILYANTNPNVNIVVETGGARKWRNNVISARTNERYRTTGNHSLVRLDQMGLQDMTNPSTLTSFIQNSVKAYPADRYMLILWDHGGGSISGYGSDELFPGNTMTLNEVQDALSSANVKFDFIGFDACLMANVETALAMEPYADYLIASEETEPGTGWYYTDWLNTLANNPSVPTVELGKVIADSFIQASAQSSRKDQTSLSVIDLAQFASGVPQALDTFAKSLTTAIENNDYNRIATARSISKEFAASTYIDQIDLVHFCQNINSAEANALISAVQSSVKYNRTNNMSNAYGLSIYFPYAGKIRMTNAIGVYDRIGMSDSYAQAIRSFASLQAGGQIATSSTTNSVYDLLGGSSTNNGTSSSYDMESLLSLLMSQSSASGNSAYGSVQDIWSGGSGSYGSYSNEVSMFDLVASLLFRSGIVDTEALQISEVNGRQVLSLTDNQWALINSIKQNVWVQDEDGYIDLGLDNVYNFDDAGNLLVTYDGNWLSINDQVCAYYMLEDSYISDSEWTTAGYVPVYFNDHASKLIIQFDQDNPNGTVLGILAEEDSGAMSKVIEPTEDSYFYLIADHYDTDGQYEDSYYISDAISYDTLPTVGVIALTNDNLLYSYVLTDIYNNHLYLPMSRY